MYQQHIAREEHASPKKDETLDFFKKEKILKILQLSHTAILVL